MKSDMPNGAGAHLVWGDPPMAPGAEARSNEWNE